MLDLGSTLSTYASALLTIAYSTQGIKEIGKNDLRLQVNQTEYHSLTAELNNLLPTDYINAQRENPNTFSMALNNFFIPHENRLCDIHNSPQAKIDKKRNITSCLQYIADRKKQIQDFELEKTKVLQSNLPSYLKEQALIPIQHNQSLVQQVLDDAVITHSTYVKVLAEHKVERVSQNFVNALALVISNFTIKMINLRTEQIQNIQKQGSKYDNQGELAGLSQQDLTQYSLAELQNYKSILDSDKQTMQTPIDCKNLVYTTNIVFISHLDRYAIKDNTAINQFGQNLFLKHYNPNEFVQQQEQQAQDTINNYNTIVDLVNNAIQAKK